MGEAQLDFSGCSPTVVLPSRFEGSNSTGETALLNSSKWFPLNALAERQALSI
jgi:hypothetical protein